MQRFDVHRMRTGKTQADAVRLSEDAWQILYDAQIPRIKDFLEQEGRRLAQALTGGQTAIRFSLPERILVLGPVDGQGRFFTIPRYFLKQRVGSRIKRSTGEQIQIELLERLTKLKGSTDLGIACSAGLLCHITALTLVERMVPAGHVVTYIAAGGEEIPSIPTGFAPPGTAAGGLQESCLDCPPEAPSFFLPDWMAFDQYGRLLARSLVEAEIQVADLQCFARLLQVAVILAPAIESSEVYRLKRAGLLGQLVNQGRALARCWTGAIIETIRKRVAAGTLNRGLSLSVPFFDDQALAMRIYDFEVIPRGRVEFVPAFVVCAARNEEEKVAQDTRFSASTRNHLLAELRTIERAFVTSDTPPRGGVKSRDKQPAARQAGTVPSCLGINPGGPD